MGILEKMSLAGKKGFVTGAARGIGKCTATAFAEAGADVAIVDMDLETAQATVKEIAEATGRKVIALACDVTDEAQVQAMVDQVVEQLGGLDFCHANAGICINEPAETMTYAQWKKNIDVNLNSVFLTDVIAGRYGNGEERRKRLWEAGFQPDAVQSIVNALMSDNPPEPPLDSENILEIEVDLKKYDGINLILKE